LVKALPYRPKVAGSIPVGVSGIFHCHNPSYHAVALVDSAFNRNKYQKYFLGVKAAVA